MRSQRALVLGVVAASIGGLLLPPASARPSMGVARVVSVPASAPAPFSTPGQLNGLAATSGHDVWAVGSSPDFRPLVLHRGRGAWSEVPVANPATGSLDAVAATSTTNAWAVGASGSLSDPTPLVLHWDGQSWTPQYGSGRGTLAGVTAISERLAWTVGSTPRGRDLVLQWNGSTWQRLAQVPRGAVGRRRTLRT